MSHADFQVTVVISDEECDLLSTRLRDLMAEVKSNPQEFKSNSDGYKTSSGTVRYSPYYDLNRFFEIFDQVHLDPGYTLDYAYVYEDGARRSTAFTRPVSSQEIFLTEAIKHLSLHTIQNLTFDRTAQGFLQCALLPIVVDQLAISWRDRFAENQLVLTPGDLERLIFYVPDFGWGDYQQKANPPQTVFEKIETKIRGLIGRSALAQVPRWTLEEQKTHATERFQRLSETIKLNPTIRRIDANRAEVTYVVFDTPGGLAYRKTRVMWPSSVAKSEDETILNYSPGYYMDW